MKPQHMIKFGVIGLDHNHIMGMAAAVIRGGGQLAAFYTTLPKAIADFKKIYPDARLATSEDEILNDSSIQLVASASIPNLRAPLGIRVMQHGKDFMSDKPGFTTLERTWARPTFEVNGLLSGFTGEGAKTVLPAIAMAKVSMRLVPDQLPDKIAELFEAYLKKISPKTVDVKLTRMHGGKPWMAAFDNPYVQAAGRAIEQGFGKSPVFNREGGSIPVVSTFQEVLGLPSVLFGVGLPDENAHAPNEKLDVGNFHGGIIASAYLYDEVARIGVPA
jgi:acetylornithine deacetylase/succinyl-diaminopimelate desuccinylase-like protein